VRIAPFEVVSFLFSLNPTYREHFLLTPADVRVTGRLDMNPSTAAPQPSAFKTPRRASNEPSETEDLPRWYCLVR
jgi:hypothetical protein